MFKINVKPKKHWTGTFREWLDNIFSENPEKHSRSAHKYLYDALYYFGADNEKNIPNKIYSEIFGVDEQVKEFLNILKAASEGHDVRRRILLFVGPVGTAKSTLVYILKRVLEEYSLTEEGALYAIKDCPLHETPLHLIPNELRKEFTDYFGVEIEGNLCPVCQYRLENDYENDIEKVPIERIFLSEQKRIGIATFVPGDYNSQDVSVLLGSENLKTVTETGDFAHPLSWNFNGSIFTSNRGLHEFVEIHKAKPDLLYPLLVVAQEREAKVDRFGMISVDEVLIAHTNYSEYQKFVAKKENEAFKDRTREIEWKYNLSLNSEVEIYKKMLKTSKSKTHIAPWTLEMIAGISILSRLEEDRSKGKDKASNYSLLDVLKMYNGDFAGKFTEKDFEEAKNDFDGRSGISPRIAVDAISFAMSKHECVSPYDAVSELVDLLNKMNSEIKKEKIEKLIELYQPEYHKWVKSVVFEAFIGSTFRKEANAYFDKYVEHAFASLNNEKVKDPFTGKYVDFDERFLRAIEEVVGIKQEQARDFRTKLLLKISILQKENKPFDYSINPKIKEAIEKKVMEDKANFIRGTITSYVKSEEQTKATKDAIDYLVNNYNFCEKCAQDAINFVAYLLDHNL